MAPKWGDEPLPPNVSYADLPITDPRCMNMTCKAFAEGYNESEKVISLLSQVQYGTYTIYFYAFWILLFTLIYVVESVDSHRLKTSAFHAPAAPSIFNKVVARFRRFTYRRFTGRMGKLKLPSFGILFILGLATIFLAILPFVESPYLRKLFRFGSPPLSVRNAFIISALTPLVIALAGKVNIISWMTGICYSRLNIFHRYVGYALFYTSTVHTVPHLIAPVQEGGLARLSQLYIDGKRELSGTPLYAIMVGLTFFSIPWIRKRAYELFAYTHIFMGWAYVGILYWHVRGEYMSPNYLYTTFAVMAFSTVLRIFYRNRSFRPTRNQRLSGYPTSLQALSGEVIRVVVSAPRSLTWRPGQHAYIRIPRLSLLDNHPFTIASIPHPPSNREAETNDLVFLIRAHKGFTHTLSSHVRAAATASTAEITPTISDAKSKELTPSPASSPSIGSTISPTITAVTADIESQSKTPLLKTIIDGPYGFIKPLHRRYNTVVLVAGGTGITSMLPHALHLTQQMRCAAEASIIPYADYCITTSVRLVWLVRSAEWLDWIQDELKTIVRDGRAAKGYGNIEVDVYVTRGEGPVRTSQNLSEESLGFERGSNNSSGAQTPKVIRGLERVASDETLGGPRMLSAVVAKADKHVEAEAKVNDELKEKDMEIEKIPAFGSSSASMKSSPTVSVKGEWEQREDMASFVNIYYAKPRMEKVVQEKVGSVRSIVVACGPELLKVEIANTIAKMQARIVNGEAKEIALHTETFGW